MHYVFDCSKRLSFEVDLVSNSFFFFNGSDSCSSKVLGDFDFLEDLNLLF